MKSHFLYEYSLMKFEELQEQHDPLLPQDKQTYNPENLHKLLEDWVREAL
jgi:hypothetical protein